MKPIAAYNDLERFARIAKGDEQAFGELFHLYTPRLYPTIMRIVRSEILAEEAIQDVFLKVWMQRTQLTTISNPGAWLHRVAANHALSALRVQARERHQYERISIAQPQVEERLEAELDGKWLRLALEEAVAQLPASRREIFTLSRNKGLSRREIAQQMGISEHTVKNQLSAALRFVQDHLNRHTGILLPCYVLFTVLLKNN